jgi:O-antigen ligase
VTLALPEPSIDALGSVETAGVGTARPSRADLIEHVTVLGALLWLVWPATVAEGGRDAGSAAFLAVPTLAAVVATRPWRHLTGPTWLLAPLVAIAALVVLPLTGVGRGGAVAALGYGLCAALLFAVAAYARTPARRATVAAVLCAGGVAQFAWALVPWWGGGDPSRPMVGTYYWHNQLAVALLLPALLGACLAVAGKRPWRSVGWIAAPVAAAGVVLSSSRATLLCLVAGWVAVVAVAVFASVHRRQALVRALVVTLLALSVTFILPGPPLFSVSSSPFSAAAARAAAGETVDANATYRTEFWRESLVVVREHPLAGAGFGRLSQEAGPLVPSSWALSPLAHSGPLQALADGGLLLGLPVLAALVAIVLGLLRRLRPRGAGAADHALVIGGALAGLALVAHSLVDIDWTYPGLAAQLGVVVGLVLATGRTRSGEKAASGPGRAIALGSALLVLALAAGAVAAWGQPFHIIDGFSVTGGAHS